jgi:hypothetical protein
MQNFKSYTEARKPKDEYTLYHSSLTYAIQEVDRYLARQGYEMDKEHAADVIGMGPAKPSKGKTNRYTVKILKNGKEQKKRVHIQVYNRGTSTNTFELNTYVS